MSGMKGEADEATSKQPSSAAKADDKAVVSPFFSSRAGIGPAATRAPPCAATGEDKDAIFLAAGMRSPWREAIGGRAAGKAAHAKKTRSTTATTPTKAPPSAADTDYLHLEAAGTPWSSSSRRVVISSAATPATLPDQKTKYVSPSTVSFKSVKMPPVPALASPPTPIPAPYKKRKSGATAIQRPPTASSSSSTAAPAPAPVDVEKPTEEIPYRKRLNLVCDSIRSRLEGPFEFGKDKLMRKAAAKIQRQTAAVVAWDGMNGEQQLRHVQGRLYDFKGHRANQYYGRRPATVGHAPRRVAAPACTIP